MQEQKSLQRRQNHPRPRSCGCGAAALPTGAPTACDWPERFLFFYDSPLTRPVSRIQSKRRSRKCGQKLLVVSSGNRIGFSPSFHSDALRPAAGFFQRLARFEQALQAGQNRRPTARCRLDQLRVGLVDFVDHGELDRFALLLRARRSGVNSLRLACSGMNSLRHVSTSFAAADRFPGSRRCRPRGRRAS